jgi:hypothetical protein
MSTDYASAYPRKRFFVEMFTRDVTLADCILDLIDNAIDGLVRTRNLDLQECLLAKAGRPAGRTKLPTIRVAYNKARFEITDNCGGIPLAEARDEAFNFGHSPSYVSSGPAGRLGVYGIGLKRAVFKMGREFAVTSRTIDDGFHLELPVDKWLDRDEGPSDWRIPLTPTGGAATLDDAGTHIEVRRLRDEVEPVPSVVES